MFLKILEPCDFSRGRFRDNLMFRGLVAESDENVPKRFKTIVRRLREFIQKLNKEYNFILLPFGDGVGLVRK